MKWKYLLVKAIGGCGVYAVEGSARYGGAAVAALAHVVLQTMHRSGGRTGMLIKVWRLFLA